MESNFLNYLADYFNIKGDELSLETLKFVLARPAYEAEYIHDDRILEFKKEQTDFFQKCIDYGEVVLYGAGTEGIAYFGELQKREVKIFAVMDTFKVGRFYGKPIISQDEYLEKFRNIPIIITPRLHKQEIKQKLNKLGIFSTLFFDFDSALMGIETTIPEAEKLFRASGERQYFSLEEIQWKDDEVFVDCGAFGGESTVDFINYCQEKGVKYQKIFAFEPDPFNVIGATETLSKFQNVTLYNAGVGDHKGIVKFETNASASHVTFEGTEEVQIVTLDEVLNGERVTFIKMDIEGSELDALKGASKIIRTQMPKLAICVYHKYEDIWEIPEYINSICPSYQFYLRHHSKGFNETVLYAIP